jgi:hypothetical protein
MRDKKTPSKLSITIIAALVVLVGLTGLVLSKQLGNNAQKSSPPAAQVQQKPKPASQTTISYDGVEGKTALELLKTKATVVTKQSSFGEYVDSINGVTGGTNGKYWAFYINGQMSQVGAGAYQTKTGDKITWKFE